MKAYRSTSAFTLIELLASIAIFAFIMLGISRMMGETTRITGRLKERQSNVLGAQVTFDRFQRELPMTFYQTRSDRKNPLTKFYLAEELGGPNLIFSYFDSPMRTYFTKKTSGQKMVRYYVERDAKSGTMNLLRAEQNLGAKEDIQSLEGQKVAKGISEIKIETYDAQNQTWIDQWDDSGPYTRRRIPSAVRILMTVTDPDLPKNEQKDKSLTYSTTYSIVNLFKPKSTNTKTTPNQGQNPASPTPSEDNP